MYGAVEYLTGPSLGVFDFEGWVPKVVSVIVERKTRMTFVGLFHHGVVVSAVWFMVRRDLSVFPINDFESSFEASKVDACCSHLSRLSLWGFTKRGLLYNREPLPRTDHHRLP